LIGGVGWDGESVDGGLVAFIDGLSLIDQEISNLFPSVSMRIS